MTAKVKAGTENPSGNVLPSGVTEEKLFESVDRSGYPLQTLAAAKLLRHFKTVIEEWSYLDRETNGKRALDIFAFRQYASTGSIVPALALLVECKRSPFPFIFFKSVTNPRLPDFPAVYGLPRDPLELTDHDQRRYIEVSAAAFFGLDGESFVKPGPVRCSAFSKVARKGSDLELSGADPFNSIVLPLLSAMDHAREYYKVAGGHGPYYPKLTLGVCVLDAPMVVADALGDDDLTLTPWVRIVRQEAVVSRRGRDLIHYAIDAVHYDYLDTFIENHVLPFAETFSERAAQSGLVLSKPRGIVPDLDNWQWSDIS